MMMNSRRLLVSVRRAAQQSSRRLSSLPEPRTLLARTGARPFNRSPTLRFLSTDTAKAAASEAIPEQQEAEKSPPKDSNEASTLKEEVPAAKEEVVEASSTEEKTEAPPGEEGADSTQFTLEKEEEKAAALPAEKREFQAETRQLLDIVTHSLYTDKEIFLRELISNASDSLEKLRHLQVTNQIQKTGDDSDMPLEIRIELDEVASTITITDTGIGMKKDELIDNLGTIAKSGSKSFLKELQQSKAAGSDVMSGIIGKFGVGFYSSFMVGRKVEFRSKSATSDEAPKVWSSDGSGTYEISELPKGVRQDRGSTIVIHFKDEHWDFVDEARIERILKKYSNFVNFPIYLNGNLVNTQKALWSMDPNQVTEDEYTLFYKYISKASDVPLETIHFRADAPLDVKALLFIPQFHGEKYGMERMVPGVSLYSRKILIEPNSRDILPDWMRFVKGVVDSEDLPLAISREKTQDSSLLAKLRRTLTRKFVSHLAKMARKEKERYLDDFYKEYSFFLKEGICHDPDLQGQLAKLIYFETSKSADEKQGNADVISFDDYVARMRPEQKEIYYLSAPTRASALNSPYLEAFEKAGVEVIFCFSDIDEFLMANLEKYEGRSIVSVDKGDIDLSQITKAKSTDSDSDSDTEDDADKLYKADRKLTSEETVEFCNWFKAELGGEKISSCTATTRLTSSPAIITDSESGAMRRMMRYVDVSEGNRDAIPLPKQHVEINPKHSVIVGLNDIREKEPVLARVVAHQIFDNCLIAAGLLDDSRSMLPRLNDILMSVVKSAKGKGGDDDIVTGKHTIGEVEGKGEDSDNIDTAEHTTTDFETKGELSDNIVTAEHTTTNFEAKGEKEFIEEASFTEKEDSKEAATEETKESKKKEDAPKKKAASKKSGEKKEKKSSKTTNAEMKA